MNRAQRRARVRAEARRRDRTVITGQVIIGAPEILSHLEVRCPECNSDIERWTDRDGRQHIDMLHDDTCPTFSPVWHVFGMTFGQALTNCA
ncbi:hypothetical protein [Mycobacterium xenopi]|uniref:Uncharacterized protein n=1 Tax=Mycobacterium xenopi TaxID=1789 RepID=A0AAD1H2K1_MYCXE|nr:hypothetical protein [Mycobacterium xenopi]MDA3639824.1 hypothetical protein [Mycobacterium xenopi]MDA3658184.1 hypothetical protein [Mycobacterium xenopi]MDA3661836.1 hypothetical protein [Mycobacterium xenopi]ORX21444.1 hypothetical protein AWC32_23325 [Mycobacterium xenopi]SPX88918.1 Uncharacterised protein [Mycobacterium xenopi]